MCHVIEKKKYSSALNSQMECIIARKNLRPKANKASWNILNKNRKKWGAHINTKLLKEQQASTTLAF